MNKNAQNSGINNDIVMKLGSVGKLNIRNTTMSKNWGDIISAIDNVIAIFLI